MKPTAALLACTLVAALPLGAQNLVPNPGFEETDTCTFGLGLGELHHWYSANLTPDHLQSCQPYGTANGLPMNQFTFQQPFEGNSCAGLFTYDGSSGEEWREWPMVPLLDTLEPGQTYYCSFRANAAFGGNEVSSMNRLASDHLGMLFTTYDRHWIWGNPYPAALNQAHVLYPQILSDTVDWTLVSGTFLADSAYTYLMIGNFFSNALTDTLHFTSGAPAWAHYGYALVDAVCVSPNPADCATAEGIEDPHTNTLQLYPNPATDHVVLTSTGPGSAFASVVLLDASGRSVPVHVERNAGRELTLRWAQPLALGVYVVRAALKSGERFTERVVVH